MNSHSHKNNPDGGYNKTSFGQKPVQAKRLINPAGDQYEQEADAIADRISKLFSTKEKTSGLIGASVQKKQMDNEGKLPVPSSFSSLLTANKGNGMPLPEAVKGFMEDAFSSDFSAVRVHTGSEAANMNEEIDAKAFTSGNHIYFNSGEFSPETTEGKKLLAHELVHVEQQKHLCQPKTIQRQRNRTRGQRGGGHRPDRLHPVRATVRHIDIHFTSTLNDRGYVIARGTATAHYGDGHQERTTVTGGSIRPGYGITDVVTDHTVHRIEGSDYHNQNGAPMPYAIFYNRGEALHVGSLSRTSHGSVHVGDQGWMRRIHNGVIQTHTTVTVRYDPGVLQRVTQLPPQQQQPTGTQRRRHR